MNNNEIFFMEKEEAKALDAILAVFTPKSWRAKALKDEFEYCEKLEAMGFIQIDHRGEDCYDILLTDAGNKFKANNKFEKQKTPYNWTKIGVIVAIIGILITILIALI